MKPHAVRGALAAALLAGAVCSGCGSDSNLHGLIPPTGPVNCDGKPDLTAEGSTAQQNAIAVFNMAWSQLCPGKQLAYNPTGSGAGREQFIAKHVDFAGSDSPLSNDQIDQAAERCNGNPAWHLPMVFGPIAIAFHLDGVTQLVVNADLLAKIFSGLISNWDDPAIARLNPATTLPSIRISPIYRSDSSGCLLYTSMPWLLAGAKTLSYAINMAALRHADRRGAGDVIFVSSDGYILEGPRSTVVIATAGDDGNVCLLTPPPWYPILRGTTQQALFEVARAKGYDCDYRALRAADLHAAQGIWLVSSMTLAARVHTLDGKALPRAPLTAEFAELVDADVYKRQRLRCAWSTAAAASAGRRQRRSSP